MLHSDIIRIAVRNGWKVSITASADDSFYFDFQCRTPGGLPFCFTAELSGGHVGTLVDEIIAFVDALDPEHYAVEWLEAAGLVMPRGKAGTSFWESLFQASGSCRPPPCR